MGSIDRFIDVFRKELLEQSLDRHSLFKNQEKWSSLTSLIIIASIEDEFGILLDVETLRKSNTIEDLYNEMNQLAKTS